MDAKAALVYNSPAFVCPAHRDIALFRHKNPTGTLESFSPARGRRADDGDSMSEQHEILIVEDSEENLIFVAQVLEDHGYSFRVAKNGKEAIAALGEKRPDLVLLDIMMPRKSGVHVYREMKKEPELAGIPIIIITGASQATGVDIKTGERTPSDSYGDDVARGVGSFLHDNVKGLEVDGLMEKPIEPQLLIEKIRALLA